MEEIQKGSILVSAQGLRYEVLDSKKGVLIIRRIGEEYWPAFETKAANVQRYGYKVLPPCESV